MQAFGLPGGDDGIRTHDPLLAGQVLSQLSYTPILNAKCKMQNAKLLGLAFLSVLVSFVLHSALRILLVGPSGLEPPTSCLSGTRSNLLSYEPMWLVSDFSHLVLVTVNSFEYYLFTLHYYLLHCKQSLRGGDDVD